jgi:hypothetical protein
MSNTNDIGIYQLKINIRSLIPNQDKLVLTSDLLNYEGQATLEKYPFFSEVHKYPRKKLQDMSYDKVIEFFFAKEIFRTKLKKRKVVNTKGNSAFQGNKKTLGGRKKYNTPAEILTLKQSNFILMLQLLFPTVYPVTNNVDTSIGIITKKPEEEEGEGGVEGEGEAQVEGEGEEEKFEEGEAEKEDKKKKDPNTSLESGSFFDFKNIQSFFSLKGTSIFNFLPGRFKQKWSYLKIGGQEYTITRTIWLNDVMNHPVYSDVIKTYHLFEIWKENKKEIQDIKEKWNIVLYVLDTSFKIPNLFERMHDKDYYTDSSNKRFSDFENMKDFDIVIDKIIKDYGVIIVDEKPKDKDKDKKYKDARNKLFEKFKENQELYTYLEKLTILFKRIQNSRISGEFNTLLNSLTSKISNLNKDKTYQLYVNDMDFEYLTNPDLSGVADKIRIKYPEFNTFVNKIQNMKERIIDNAVWKQVIQAIITGKKYHNFKSKIWDKVEACYGLNVEEEEDVSDDEGDEEDEGEEGEEEEEEEKKPEKKIGTCSSSEKVFYVNFDQIVEKDPNQLPDMKLIDIYLQIDVIEGKINDTNMSAINCDYTNMDLGKTWETLMNGSYSWDLTQQMFFYSAKKQLELFDKQNSVIGSSEETAVKK